MDWILYLIVICGALFILSIAFIGMRSNGPADNTADSNLDKDIAKMKYMKEYDFYIRNKKD